MLIFDFKCILKDSHTSVQRPPKGPHKSASCKEVVAIWRFINQNWFDGIQTGLCLQVVFVRRWQGLTAVPIIVFSFYSQKLQIFDLKLCFEIVPILRSKLFSTSGRILSVIELNSFRSLHKKYSRAPPEMWQDYELAVSLFDLNTTRQPVSDWHLLQGNTLGNKRSSKLHFTSTNNLRCGLNLLPNRLKTILNRIEKEWLTFTKECYKQRCKKEFITIPLPLSKY